MAETTITLYCSFCMEKSERVVSFDGWETRYGGIDHENAICPQHAGAKAFVDDQCPGCVSGWGDCGLSNAANLMPNTEDLSQAERYKIAAGICPRRVNGTMTMTATSKGVVVGELDISEPSEAGNAMLLAIDDLQALTRKLRAERRS